MSQSSNQNSEKMLSSSEGGSVALIRRIKIFCNEQITKNAFNVQVTPFEYTSSTKKAAILNNEKDSHQENESSDRSHHLTKSKSFLRRNSSRIAVSAVACDHTDDELKTANDSQQGNETPDKIQLTKSKSFLNRIIASTITSDHVDDNLKTANDSQQGNGTPDKIQFTKSKSFLNRIIASAMTSDHTDDNLKTANDSQQGNETPDKIQLTKSKSFLNRIIASAMTSDHTDDNLKTASDSQHGNETPDKIQLTKSKSFLNRIIASAKTSDHVDDNLTTANDSQHGNETSDKIQLTKSKSFLNRIIASAINNDSNDHLDDNFEHTNDSQHGEEVPNKGHFRKSKSVLNRTLSRGVSSLGLGMKKTKTDGKLTEKELSWHDSETMSISIHDSSYRTNDSSIRANELSVSIHNTSIRSNGSSRNSGSNRSIESSANTNIRNSRLSNASKLRDVGRCSRVLEISNDTNNEYLPSGISPYIGIQDGVTVTNEITPLQFLKSNFPYAHQFNTILSTVKKELTKRHILPTNTIFIESKCLQGGHNMAQVFEAYFGQCIHLKDLSGLPGSENFKAMITSTQTQTNSASGRILENDMNLFILFSPQMTDSLDKQMSFKITKSNENVQDNSQLCFVMREVSKRFENVDVNAPEYVEHAELAKEKFMVAKKYLDQIIALEGWDTHYNLIILGGVQIHVPGLSTDYFEPLFFEIRHRNRAKVLEVTQLIDCFNYDYYCTSTNHHNSHGDNNVVRVVT